MECQQLKALSSKGHCWAYTRYIYILG